MSYWHSCAASVSSVLLLPHNAKSVCSEGEGHVSVMYSLIADCQMEGR